MATDKQYTTTAAAAELDLTSARIRQFCIASHEEGSNPIGTVFGHVWMLSDEDLDKIRALRLLDGRRRENKRATA